MFLRTRAGRWQDWGNLILGIWLFISPWVLAFVVPGGNPWSAWIVGVLVFLAALWALAMPRLAWTEWILGILGVWLFISPWVLHFTGLGRDAWNAWIVGAVIFILAVWALAQLRSRPPVSTLGPYGNAGPLGTWRGPVEPREPVDNYPPNAPVNP